MRQPAIEKDLVRRVELDRAVERALGREHGRRHVAVEGDVGVGEVVHEDELVLAREVDEPLHQLGRRDRGGRVVREGRDHDARHGLGGLERLLDARSTSPSSIRACSDGRAGEARRDQVDRVGGARDDDAVALLDEHPHQVREALLGADRADDVRLGVELHAEDLAVALADRFTQIREPAARRVAMVRRLRGGLAELFNRNLGRRDVGVAEAEVDHVAPVAPQLALQLRRPSRRRKGEDRGFAGIPMCPSVSGGCHAG